MCHSMSAWLGARFDHAAVAHFALTGAHRAVACSTCHKKQAGITQFVSAPTACADCHTDVHGGRFDQPGKPPIVDGRSGCARCHATSSFSQIPWTGQDHALWTGYTLNGKHATATCAACHPPREHPDEHGRKLGIAATTCSACHADPHAGQFAKQGDTDCTRCHSDAGRFTETSFDHQKDSAFKLDKDHVKLACDACHRPVAVSAEVKVIRYRPLGRTCGDCHDPRGMAGKEPR